MSSLSFINNVFGKPDRQGQSFYSIADFDSVKVLLIDQSPRVIVTNGDICKLSLLEKVW